MRKIVPVLCITITLAACTGSSINPETKIEMKASQTRVNECLANQVSKLMGVYPDPEIVAEVAASRCEHTAYEEAEKLQNLNRGNKIADGFSAVMIGYSSGKSSVVNGFTKAMTDKAELKSTALSILLMMMEDANNANSKNTP